MSLQEKLQFVADEVHNRIEMVKAKRTKNKHLAFWLKVSTIALGGIVTVIVGAKVTESLAGLSEFWFPNIALVLSATITVISAVDAFYDYRSLWVRETVTMVRLIQLSEDIIFYMKGRDDVDYDLEEVTRFKDRFHKITSADLQAWSATRKADELMPKDRE